MGVQGVELRSARKLAQNDVEAPLYVVEVGAAVPLRPVRRHGAVAGEGLDQPLPAAVPESPFGTHTIVTPTDGKGLSGMSTPQTPRTKKPKKKHNTAIQYGAHHEARGGGGGGQNALEMDPKTMQRSLYRCCAP